MTREEAIWRLESCLECTDCFTCGSHDEALGMAIAALREQEERSKSVLTNADRIRAMSDEELAEFMCDNDNSWVTSMGRQLRYDNYLEWLQQPVKEDA